MLDRVKDEPWTTPVATEADPALIDLGETVRAAVATLWRQRFLIAAIVAAFLAFAIFRIMTAVPQFTATASIIIDPRISAGQGAKTAPSLLVNDALVVDSEVRVLKSRELASRLIDRLGLLDEERAPSEPGVIARAGNFIRNLFGTVLEDATPEEIVLDEGTIQQRRRESVRRSLLRGLDVARSGETYVIDISYTSPDPAFSAEVANALVEEYFLSQAETSFENTRRVNEWLGERVESLAGSVATADEAVEAYRTENDLFSVGGGDLLPSQAELTVANNELINIRSEIVRANASLAQLEQAIAEGTIDVTIDSDARPAALNELRQDYAELVARDLDYSSRLGENHILVRRTRDELSRTRSLILDEFRKVAATLRSRLQTLQRRSDETSLRIVGLRASSADDALKSIRLRELQREASSKRKLYETMLQRLDETSEQEGFQVSPARVIAYAVPPDKKSAPQSKLIVALSLFGGLVLGGGIALGREALDDVFRKPDDVEALGIPFIGMVPMNTDDKRMVKSGSGEGITRREAIKRGLSKSGAKLRFAADYPSSMFAETIRSLAATLARSRTQRGGCVVLGFTSVQKGEGKSTLAGNFATAQASRGFRVAMLDLDLRSPQLTSALMELPEANLLDNLIEEPELLAQCEQSEGLMGVTLIGNGGRNGPLTLSDPNVIESIGVLIERMKPSFDYIVADLTPMSGLIDARLGANVVDQIVMAIEWGRTSESRVKSVLATNHEVRSRLAGVIFTKAKLRAYSSYNGAAAREYYGY